MHVLLYCNIYMDVRRRVKEKLVAMHEDVFDAMHEDVFDAMQCCVKEVNGWKETLFIKTTLIDHVFINNMTCSSAKGALTKQEKICTERYSVCR